ncbi:MAG: hypothetical protein ABIG42_02220, partial [bacterium]
EEGRSGEICSKAHDKRKQIPPLRSLAMLGHSVGMTFPLSRAFSTAPGRPRSHRQTGSPQHMPPGRPRSHRQTGSPQHKKPSGRSHAPRTCIEECKHEDCSCVYDVSVYSTVFSGPLS